ncbi:MAG TPA: 3-(methylthio)propionyl-CoA ligase [Stellaceae bacterium]|nr:3-(methylthio)propionyl-CoA ligase [Stellaceae bacterium]
MRGLMMDGPLLIQTLLDHAAQYHADTEIVSRTNEGPIHRYTYAEAERRSKRLANALRRLGIKLGDRVGTLAWNGYRHYELYFGVSGIGAICHTINPRLFHDQLNYIVNHAEDALIFFDLSFAPLIEKLAPGWKPVKHFVAMTDRAHMPSIGVKNLLCYEELIAAETPELTWADFEESTASSLCYTSGTTGNPKGALYSHRSTVLHSFACCSANNTAFAMWDSVCPIVPMFHANAWGVPYSCTMAGSKLVFPGPNLDGASLQALFESEKVSLMLGVPTVWLGLLKYLEESGKRIDSVNRVLIGGSAAPPAMIKTFEEKYGVTAFQGWGMTELSPVGTLGTLKTKFQHLPKEVQLARKAMQGRPLFGVEMKLVDADGKIQPHDGQARGELFVRGPWVVGGYYKDEKASRGAVDAEGWFGTGDVATIDPDGYLQLVDRSKDVIKSGGEWISSIDIENAAIAHPDVAEAAVIGVPHPKWAERPLLIVVPKEGRAPTREAMLAFLKDKVAKWALPDDVVLLKELPHTATGKILKTKLREIFAGHRLPGA